MRCSQNISIIFIVYKCVFISVQDKGDAEDTVQYFVFYETRYKKKPEMNEGKKQISCFTYYNSTLIK